MLSTAVLNRLIHKGILIWSGGWSPWRRSRRTTASEEVRPCLWSLTYLSHACSVTDVYNSVWEWRFNNSNLCLAEVTHEKLWPPLGAPYTRSRASRNYLLHRKWRTKCFRWHCTGSVTLSSTNWYILSMIFGRTLWAIATSLPVGWHWWCASSVAMLTKYFFVTAAFSPFQEQYWPFSLDIGYIVWSQCKLWFSFFMYPAGKHSCYCAPWTRSTFYRTGSQEGAFHQWQKECHWNEQSVLLLCTSRVVSVGNSVGWQPYRVSCTSVNSVQSNW